MEGFWAILGLRVKVYDSDVECRLCVLWARNTIWGLGLRRAGSGFGIFGGWVEFRTDMETRCSRG